MIYRIRLYHFNEMNQPRTKVRSLVDVLSPTQRKVYSLLNAYDSLTVGEVAKRLEISRSTASRTLNCLFSYAILDRVASGRMIFYSIDYKEVKFLESSLNKPKPVDKAGRWNCNRYYY